MNISPVRYNAAPRFGNTAGTFSDIINKPQAYSVKTETPTAATNISSKEGKSHKGLKVVGGLAVAAAAVATAVALLATKTNVLLPKEGGNAILEKAKGYLAVAGNVIADAAVKAKDFIFEIPSKIKNKLPNQTT